MVESASDKGSIVDEIAAHLETLLTEKVIHSPGSFDSTLTSKASSTWGWIEPLRFKDYDIVWHHCSPAHQGGSSHVMFDFKRVAQELLSVAGVDQLACDKIVAAISYFEKNAPDSPIGIGAVCERSHGNVVVVKKVLSALLLTKRLEPTFKAYCKACGYLGEKATSVRQVDDSCPCCYHKIMPIIEFWASGHRPEVEVIKSAVNA